jgi:small-conductance mechanosensitive channel
MPKTLVAALSIAALVVSTSATAQTGRRASAASADPDMKELAAYTLTMDTVNRVDRAMHAMAANMAKDPKYAEQMKLQKELEALKKKDDTTAAEDKRMEQIEARLEQLEAESSKDTGDTNSISDMERKINAMPVMANALKQEGVSARDFAKFSLAMLQASFAVGAKQMTAKSGKPFQLPEGVNPANIKFVEEHQAELKKLQDNYGQFSVK